LIESVFFSIEELMSMTHPLDTIFINVSSDASFQ